MTIFRGPGGTGSASSDSDTTEFQEFLVQSQAARDAAQAAQAAAEAAEAGAEAAAGNVDAGVAASAASATAAAGSASSAATSATAAAASAASAATQAGTAGVYAANAASAASAAASSMSAANTSATNAAASATASAASATNSANSATASAASATNAATSATNAGVYAAQSATSSSEAATSAVAANTSANNAGVSASSAASSASASAASAAAAALALDNFDDRYLGVKTAAPSLDNDGNALVAGALYFNSGAVTPADKGMWVYDGGTWIAASAASQAILVTYEYVATAGQTTFTGADANGVSLSYTAGSIIVTLNGVKLRPGNDYTATNGNSVVLVVGAAAGDDLVVDAFSTFDIANTYTQAQVNALLATKMPVNGPAFGAVTPGTKSASNATTTEMTGYSAALFDTAACFNTTTGRFTPTVPGYYQVSWSIDFGANGVGAASSVAGILLKNGTVVWSGGIQTSSSCFGAVGACTVVYLNGSTDYVSAAVFQNTGGTVSNFLARFSGAMIRSAT